MSDIVVSLLTPSGTGAIATVEVRGPRAYPLAKHLFKPTGKPLPKAPEVNRFWFGTLGGDEVVLTVTAVDAVEVHCHGGRRVVQLVTDLFLAETSASGGRKPPESSTSSPATPAPIPASTNREGLGVLGGLTPPARLLQRAPTLRTASILLDQLNGAFANEVRRILALLETGPNAMRDPLGRLAQIAPVGRHLIEPWRVVFAGAPNVGKSSIVNALAGYQRAVVSETAGTTRDAVSVRVALDGWPYELIDTAGLRVASGLEAEGIERTERELVGADLVVWVLDGTAEEPSWPTGPLHRPVWYVVNKVDQSLAPWVLSEADDVPGISAVSGAGIRGLIDGILLETVALFDTLEGANVPFPSGGWASVPGLPVPFSPHLADLTEAANTALGAGRINEAARLLREALAVAESHHFASPPALSS